MVIPLSINSIERETGRSFSVHEKLPNNNKIKRKGTVKRMLLKIISSIVEYVGLNFKHLDDDYFLSSCHVVKKG